MIITITGWGSGERMDEYRRWGWWGNLQIRGEEKKSMNPKFFGWPDRGTRGSKWVTFMSPDAHQPDVKPPPWMDVAIGWTRGHANGRGAAMTDSGAFDWKSAVKSSTSVWGWSWVNLLHVNATLHGRLNQNSRCYPFFSSSSSSSVNVSPGALPWQIFHSVIHFHSQPKLDPSFLPVNYRQYRLFLGIVRDPFSVLNHIRREIFKNKQTNKCFLWKWRHVNHRVTPGVLLGNNLRPKAVTSYDVLWRLQQAILIDHIPIFGRRKHDFLSLVNRCWFCLFQRVWSDPKTGPVSVPFLSVTLICISPHIEREREKKKTSPSYWMSFSATGCPW